MAKSTYDYACRHGSVQIDGRNRADADYRVARMARQGVVCRDCEHAEANAAAALRSAEAGLPVLTGSEKQVAWATSLRLERLDAMDQTVGAMLGDGACSPEIHTEVADAAALMRLEMTQQTEARWWIDLAPQSLERNGLLDRMIARGLTPTLAALESEA